jgi:DNA modification methylase
VPETFGGGGVTWEIRQGDALERLREMPDESVQCCVTSPPYFGLRDYGVDGHLGLEETPTEFVEAMVGVFAEVRRALRDDGTLWLNIGDSYAGSWGAQSREHAGKHAPNVSAISANQVKAAPRRRNRTGAIPPGTGLKPKDLIGIPWRLAFALQAAGWYLRRDIIWAKPNPMPESVTDRPTSSHEYLFLLSKSSRYFYDAEAIREEGVWAGQNRADRGPRQSEMPGAPPHRGLRRDKQRGHGRRHDGFNDRWDSMSKDEQQALGRNKRSVWTIATRPYAAAHFATFPPDLVEPCILAGTAEGDTVLDPFAGAATTGLVATRHNRDFIGIELNPEYVELGRNRIRDDAPLLNTPAEAAA